MFLLTKKPHYFYDNFVVSEETVGPRRTRRFSSAAGCKARNLGDGDSSEHRYWTDNGRRNKRSVWSIATKPFKGAHSAAYPEALITPPILAGTSEKGCCSVCGEPWVRQIEKVRSSDTGHADGAYDRTVGDRNGLGLSTLRGDHSSATVGWKRDCNCEGRTAVPCIVLDPFNGAATTSLVARNLGRRYLGIELSQEYCDIANKRLSYDADIITAAEKIKSSDFDDLLI